MCELCVIHHFSKEIAVWQMNQLESCNLKFNEKVNLPPVLIVHKSLAIHNFSKDNAVWQMN